ncbi:glycerophosphodiester phosphodiesterase family protein, partial [Yoonia sp.]|uniref:glycerophosphodiester phosphodiesterase family protein n=1 Tax=Yoonia sp. TaxID=2212373 RepID=UPI003975185B
MTLPASFLTRPIAHRALHDRKAGRMENSVKSIKAAIDAGYGIEIDVQLTCDGHAMVFHDDRLDRLTGETGPVRARTRAELEAIALTDDCGTIPSLEKVLEMVAGQVPLLIEIKDQDGAMGPQVGPLEAATCAALKDYAGDVALMSFNPHAVAVCAELAP